MRCPHFIAPIYTPAPAKNPPVFPLQKAERVSVRLCCGKVISIFWVSRKDETQAYPVCDIKEQHIICLDWTDFVRFCSVSAPLDIDECTSGTHGCKHYCVNNDGSFKCHCIPGYTLHEDERSCNGNSDSTANYCIGYRYIIL